MEIFAHPETTQHQINEAVRAANGPTADISLDLHALIAVSQCSTTTWRAVGNLVHATAARKGSLNIGVGDNEVFVLQEWDDRNFVQNPIQRPQQQQQPQYVAHPR